MVCLKTNKAFIYIFILQLYCDSVFVFYYWESRSFFCVIFIYLQRVRWNHCFLTLLFSLPFYFLFIDFLPFWVLLLLQLIHNTLLRFHSWDWTKRTTPSPWRNSLSGVAWVVVESFGLWDVGVSNYWRQQAGRSSWACLVGDMGAAVSAVGWGLLGLERSPTPHIRNPSSFQSLFSLIYWCLREPP